MKANSNKFSLKSIFIILLVFCFSNVLPAQNDSTQLTQNKTETVNEGKDKKQKKDKKRKDEFKVYAGVNLNQINIANERYYSNMGIGWDLGFSYKRGKFFYWEIGARYNNPVYVVRDNQVPADSMDIFDGAFGVRNIDIPITGGINFLSITSRIVGLRVFVSAVPSFNLGVGSNDLDITKNDLNSFILYGQAGVGVDIAFLFVEAGFNYGFTNLANNEFKTNPYQLNVNLGFRF